jgi:hypothetical protein
LRLQRPDKSGLAMIEKYEKIKEVIIFQ